MVDTENKEGYTADEIAMAIRKCQWSVPLTEREAAAYEWWNGVMDLIMSDGTAIEIRDEDGKVLEKHEIEKKQVN